MMRRSRRIRQGKKLLRRQEEEAVGVDREGGEGEEEDSEVVEEAVDEDSKGLRAGGGYEIVMGGYQRSAEATAHFAESMT
jgi:hypothetical protein